MFSGIVVAIGEVEELRSVVDGDLSILISTSESFLQKLKPGSSVACSGVCLTVVAVNQRGFTVNVSAATLSITNLGSWQRGFKINLELALMVGDPLDGHMVQGHVDGMGKVESVTQSSGSHVIELSHDKSLSKYIAQKCSIALDGVSMTVNSVSEGAFSVNVIPYTWDNTTFQYRTVGDIMNIETDMIARYIERARQFHTHD